MIEKDEKNLRFRVIRDGVLKLLTPDISHASAYDKALEALDNPVDKDSWDIVDELVAENKPMYVRLDTDGNIVESRELENEDITA